MNLSLSNQWGIVRTIIDMCMSMPEGKYVLVKVATLTLIQSSRILKLTTASQDPNKPVLRLYEVPPNTFDEEIEAPIQEEDEE